MLAWLWALLSRTAVLTDWSEVQEDIDNGRTSPDLTVFFLILAAVLFVGLSAYVMIKVWLNAKHEREKLERGMRAGIPHIKALDNNLPGRSLSNLYKENNIEKRK